MGIWGVRKHKKEGGKGLNCPTLVFSLGEKEKKKKRVFFFCFFFFQTKKGKGKEGFYFVCKAERTGGERKDKTFTC